MGQSLFLPYELVIDQSCKNLRFYLEPIEPGFLNYTSEKIILTFSIFLFHCEGEDSIDILMTTEIGTIEIELLPNQAPITVKKFLRYIDEDRYSDFTFYRVVNMRNQNIDNVKIEVIQGGLGFNKHSDVLPPISHESTNVTNLKHLNGTISMARNEPGTASSEIFICINDQPELDYNGSRNPDGFGFSTFGLVKSGMDIVKTIQQSPSSAQMLDKPIKVKSIKGI